MRMPDSEWLPFAPEEPGSIRINHTSSMCSGSSNSLKITRTDDDRIYAKCYRCGGWGSHAGRMAAVSSLARRLRSAHTIIPREVKLPSDMSMDFKSFPVRVRSYLSKCGVSAAELSAYGIGWSEKWERLILPLYRGSDVEGFQARYFGDETDQPKYITRYKNSGDFYQNFPARSATDDGLCVIVEDMLSAVRVAKQFNAVCLYGTEMSDKCLDLVVNSYERAIIWTDYDNYVVRKKGTAMRRRLTSLGIDAKILMSVTDPKHYTDEEIMGYVSTFYPGVMSYV